MYGIRVTTMYEIRIYVSDYIVMVPELFITINDPLPDHGAEPEAEKARFINSDFLTGRFKALSIYLQLLRVMNCFFIVLNLST